LTTFLLLLFSPRCFVERGSTSSSITDGRVTVVSLELSSLAKTRAAGWASSSGEKEDAVVAVVEVLFCLSMVVEVDADEGEREEEEEEDSVDAMLGEGEAVMVEPSRRPRGGVVAVSMVGSNNTVQERKERVPSSSYYYLLLCCALSLE